MSKHGKLDKWVMSSELQPYPCAIRIPDSILDAKEDITLQEAARLSANSNHAPTCHCRTGCKSKLCKCQKEGQQCHSRCHRGGGCNNKTADSSSSMVQDNCDKSSSEQGQPGQLPPDTSKVFSGPNFHQNDESQVAAPHQVESNYLDSKVNISFNNTNQGVATLFSLDDIVLPKYGGQVQSSKTNNAWDLENTCPVDNWLMVLKILSLCQPTVFESFVDVCTKAKSPITKFIDYIKMNNYTAKLQIACLNGLKAANRTINFHGNEFENFLYHLRFLVSHDQHSLCGSKYCKTSINSTSSEDFPAISAATVICFLIRSLSGCWGLRRADVVEGLKRTIP